MDFLFSLIKGVSGQCWFIMEEASPYVLFGLFIGGLLYLLVPQEKIAKLLGPSKFNSVIYAALIGVPIPVCSCAVLPLAVSLRKQGASKGATTAFLISTPETGVDSIALTYALMDPLMTIWRPISAFLTATIAGILENLLSPWSQKAKTGTAESIIKGCKVKGCEKELCDEEVSDHNHSLMEHIKTGLHFAYWEVLGEIGLWLLIGIGIAGLIAHIVPVEIVERVGGNGLGSMLIMVLVGVPLYICATASTPIVAALVAKGLNPGAALVFLLVGPATNVASISVIANFMGKRSATIYLVTIVVTSLLMGTLLNLTYSEIGLTPYALKGKARELIPDGIKTVSALLLLFLILFKAFMDRWSERAHVHSSS